MRESRQQSTCRPRWGRYAALAALVAGAGACDQLLEVELPTAITAETLESPNTAALQVNSVMALVECGYSSFALDAAGFEDNFQRVSGVAGLYSEYREAPGGGACDGDSYSSEWIDPMTTARGQGMDVYERLDTWTDAQVDEDDLEARERLMATVALYTAVPLDIFGEFFCEMAIDEGPLMTPVQTLDLAEQWVNTALTHIGNVGDFRLVTNQGVVAETSPTTGAEAMAYGLRARIRWAKGDLAGAAADAAMVPDGFYAYILREDGEDRRNMVSSMQGGGGGVQAAGFLQGPVELKTATNSYGVSLLGNDPSGTPWPNPVPFTGYLNLAIAPDGRAVDASGYPITTATAGAVADVRVPHRNGNTAGGSRPIIQKYTSLTDDIPLVSWVEMRLIRAEAEAATPANAIAHVNAVRNGAVYIGGATETITLPNVTYGPATADEIEDMIIEERRRGLWLEGRYWATKILNTDKLWFPRAVGDWVNVSNYVLNGGVRLLMEEAEYNLNPNFDLSARGTQCDPDQAPVFN